MKISEFLCYPCYLYFLLYLVSGLTTPNYLGKLRFSIKFDKILFRYHLLAMLMIMYVWLCKRFFVFGLTGNENVPNSKQHT
jgi:hypothetical protein